MRKPKKGFEPDPDIGKPCQICGSIYKYRVTLKCTKCGKKVVCNCETPAQAVAMEESVAQGVTHKTCDDAKMKARRWRTHEHHHISYKEEKTVLLCYLCHQRMHGNAAITSHPFKKQYAKDIEPFIFAACVTSMYVENMPELQEQEKGEPEVESLRVDKKFNNTTH